MATGNLIRVTNTLVKRYDLPPLESIEDIPRLVYVLRNDNKNATADWLENYYNKLLIYVDGEFDMDVNVHV